MAYAKQKHHTLFEQIAEDHARIGAELEAKRLLFESTSEKSIEELQHEGGQVPVAIHQHY